MANKRYVRQTVLPEIGKEGQAKLAAARVVVVGCGGLGSPAAVYLAGAGVGELVLIDGDKPDLTNLHRQVFFDLQRPGSKAEQLAERCRQLNPEIAVEVQVEFLEDKNAQRLLAGASIVLDGTDHPTTKHLLSDACHHLRLPLLYAAAQGFEGYLALFPNTSAQAIHLRDLYPEPDPSLPDCATAGVLPSAVGIIALLQANAALCFLLGIGDPPIDCLLTYSALDNRQHRIRLNKNYQQQIPAPWERKKLGRKDLEIDQDSFRSDAFDGVFSMLSEEREPDLMEGAVRLAARDPFGQCLDKMEDGKRYVLYCNSGKLSLILAAQIKKTRPLVEVFSLQGGVG